jgi:excisionase family DNA binding protein
MADETRREWTTKQLAEAAGVSTAYLRQLLLAGTLKGQKVGRDWLIFDRDAQRWLASRKTGR